ncbi:MAG TPA: HlyD family type I secretion periplasmic adaptor subunit, partial [Halieaceae bacterium]|nr:HlyD family type I secretion periplasmic adaptor subunit [Halieaceae bacterium]
MNEEKEATPVAPAPERPRRFLADFIFAPWMRATDGARASWEQDAHRAYLQQQPLRARGLLYVVAFIVLALVVWAAFAEVDEVTRGEGKVIPSQQIQVMQSQDGGVVTEIHARAGDVVESGQLLVRLDQTRSASNLRENQAEFRALSVRAARLTANLA